MREVYLFLKPLAQILRCGENFDFFGVLQLVNLAFFREFWGELVICDFRD